MSSSLMQVVNVVGHEIEAKNSNKLVVNPVLTHLKIEQVVSRL